ncbi:MAG: hypothetical protein K2X49_20370, partial [Acetobacteraceae bacterium]|nr:hypothetical protein [Acetobacteraceae bacterium]
MALRAWIDRLRGRGEAPEPPATPPAEGALSTPPGQPAVPVPPTGAPTLPLPAAPDIPVPPL